MSDSKFVGGVRAFKPKKDFIKAELIISLNEFVSWCKEHPDMLTDYNGVKQIKLQVKESKDGKDAKGGAEGGKDKPKDGEAKAGEPKPASSDAAAPVKP